MRNLAIAQALGALLILVAISGCNRLQRPIRPPPVTGCLAVPVAAIPDAPRGPAPGEALSDRYVVALQGWANQLLGVITADRIAWRGEHQCIRALQKKGLVE